MTSCWSPARCGTWVTTRWRRATPGASICSAGPTKLRSALGARPHTAAAAATLAAARPTGTEAGQLREAARITATELHPRWLLGAL